MNSRGAATECGPGREPGAFFRHGLSPGGAKESFGIFRPSGAAFRNDTYPGLAPGATLCRRSAAELQGGFSFWPPLSSIPLIRLTGWNSTTKVSEWLCR